MAQVSDDEIDIESMFLWNEIENEYQSKKIENEKGINIETDKSSRLWLIELYYLIIYV